MNTTMSIRSVVTVVVVAMVGLMSSTTAFTHNNGFMKPRYAFKTSTELGPNYPASQSNIHPAPKFRFKNTEVIKAPREPNWVATSDMINTERKNPSKKKVTSPPPQPPTPPTVAAAETTNAIAINAEVTSSSPSSTGFKRVDYEPPNGSINGSSNSGLKSAFRKLIGKN